VLLERSFKLYTKHAPGISAIFDVDVGCSLMLLIRDRLELDQHQHISAPRHSMEIECKTQRINTVTNVKTPGRLRCPCAPETPPIMGYYICVIINVIMVCQNTQQIGITLFLPQMIINPLVSKPHPPFIHPVRGQQMVGLSVPSVIMKGVNSQ